MEREPRDVAVVGGGIAGSAAALRAAQYGQRVVWIRGGREEARRSRGRYVLNVDNMIGVHPGIVQAKVAELLAGPELAAARERVAAAHFHVGTLDIARNALERIRADWGEAVEVLDEPATAAARAGEGFALTLASGDQRRARSVVLATGVMDRQPRVKRQLSSGRVLDDVRWIFPYANYERLLYCIRCEGHLTRDTPTAVIGAGEQAAQIALMLHERYGNRLALLFNGEASAIEPRTLRLLEAYRVERHPERIVDLYDEPEGEAPPGRKPRKGTELHGLVLEGGARVPARFAMVALGLHRVYNELARELGAELEAGVEPDELRHVLIEDATAETSVPDLFAVGDLAQRRDGGPSMKQVYTAQEYAVRAVDTIDRRRRARERARVLGEV